MALHLNFWDEDPKIYSRIVFTVGARNFSVDENLAYKIITGDEIWFYSYDPERKQPSIISVFQSELKLTKVVRLRSASKQMIAGFSDLLDMWNP